jgi:DNA-binding MarR family transcriptional regulator
MARDRDEESERDLSTDESLTQLERLARLMRGAAHVEGLNPAQWEALRYLARANRFSNAPGALTRYLGATKGTISQTVIALVRKGLITKTARVGEARSVALALTPEGTALLARDPLAAVGKDIEGLGPKTRRRFNRAVGELLAAGVKRGQETLFGTCLGCRHFRARGAEDKPGGPHACLLFQAALGKPETSRLCAHHLP